MFLREFSTLDFSVSVRELYRVVISGFCIPQYNTIAATAVKVASNVGNALRNPGWSIASRTLARAFELVANKPVL